MNLKIPPALLVLLFAIVMWLIDKLTELGGFEFEFQEIVSKLIFGIGGFTIFMAMFVFKKSKTTIDPTRPEKASALVVRGIYKITRNPMYLGMFFILLAFAIRLGNLVSFLVLPLYIWYITKYQIKPEEIALTATFGKEFENYSKNVNRWL